MFCSLRVKIGATRRSQLRGFEEIDAAQIIKHEHFEPEPSYNNDIGLIILEKPYRNTGMIKLKFHRNVHVLLNVFNKYKKP